MGALDYAGGSPVHITVSIVYLHDSYLIAIILVGSSCFGVLVLAWETVSPDFADRDASDLP